MSDNLSDIWARVLRGDQAAWRRLVELLAPLAFSVARRSGLSMPDTEDCVQQTWMDLYRGRERIGDPQSLPAWLIRVTSRKAARIHSRTASYQRARQHAPVPDPGALPDEGLRRLELSAQLRLGLNELGLKCKRLLRAVFFSPGDRSYADIARELGIPVNSMGPTRSRCLSKLRKILEDMGYE